MQSHLTKDEFNILNYLDIFKSVTDVNSIQTSTGLDPERITSILARFVEKGYTEKGIYIGHEAWKITPAGETFVNSYRQFILAQTGQKETIIKKCEEFENLNVKFKELVTGWQVKIINGTPILNDHSDPEYDSAILNQIFDLHKNVIRILEEMASILPIYNYKNYIERFDFAIKKLKEGTFDYIAKDKNSYHNVWFELHESILKLWGRERIE